MEQTIEYPKLLQTREDYEFIMTNFPKEKWEPDVHKLLFDAFEDVLVGVVKISAYNYKETDKLFKKDYVTNYKKIIRKLFRITEDTTIGYETIIRFNDNSELRKYKEFDNYYFHVKTRVDPEAKAIRIGFTTDELFAILFGFLDPSIKSTINKLEELNKQYEGMIQDVERIEEQENNSGGNEDRAGSKD